MSVLTRLRDFFLPPSAVQQTNAMPPELSLLDKYRAIIESPDVPPAHKMRVSAIAMQGWMGQGGIINQWTGEKYYGAMGYPPIVHRNPTLERRRSRIAWIESIQARALLESLVDNTVGPGMRLEALPVWQLLEPESEVSPETFDAKHQKWTRETQIRFDLYMASKDPDITGRKSGYELQRLFFLNYLRDGEVFVLFNMSPDASRLNQLEIQFVGPDQIMNPHDTAMFAAAEARGNRIVEGIELDADNKEVAFFVFDEKKGTSQRVTKYGPKSKRQFMVHALIQESIGQVRGTPILSSLVHELHKITDYSVAELESAVVNATYALWVKPGPEKRATDIFRGLTVTNTAAALAASTPVPNGADPRAEPPQLGLDIQPGKTVSRLGPSEELVSFDSKRPNVNFGTFVDTIVREVAASVRVPFEVVEMKFGESYSAARATLLLFWNVVEGYRDSIASDFLNPIYEQWFAEEVRTNRVKAPGFSLTAPVTRRAWLKCDWIGVPMPAMNPTDEARADDMRIAAGLTTRERAARKLNGSDYSENAQRLKIENRELAEANKTLAVAKPVDKLMQGDEPASPDQPPPVKKPEKAPPAKGEEEAA